MNKPLSASRIKTLQECSWKYYCKYILKLPDQTNDGALRGTCVHSIFECLGNPRHKHIYNQIIENNDPYSNEVVLRYVKSFLKNNQMDLKNNFELIKIMILEGAKADFYGNKCSNANESHSELDFDLEIKEDGKDYRILGFIDKLFLYKEKSLALIRDFKTSSNYFKEYEIEDNMQDMMYRLAVKYLYPDFYKRKMQFLFLRYDCSEEGDGNIFTPEVSEEDLDGFEYFLTEIQKIINEFNSDDAGSNLAYNKGFPLPEEGFSKRLLCGFADYPGHLKKDGSLRWHCPFKFEFDYYILLDDSGEIIKTSKNKEELKKLKKENAGSIIESKNYGGCPAFVKKKNYFDSSESKNLDFF